MSVFSRFISRRVKLGVASQFMDLGNLLSQMGYGFDSFDPGLQCQARTRGEFELQRPVKPAALIMKSAYADYVFGCRLVTLLRGWQLKIILIGKFPRK